jgi:hypothetical protein
LFTETEIDRIGRAVQARSLPDAQWTHQAHFAAAFWVLSHPGMVAERDLPGLVRAYNEACGRANTDSSGYHETITQASLRVARAFLAADPQAGRAAALNALLRSRFGSPEWLLVHYSRERLFSVQARRGWVEPDLSPLPF